MSHYIKLENFGNSPIVKKWRQNFAKCLIKLENFGNSSIVEKKMKAELR